MHKRSFLLVAGACLATLSLTAGTAIADPVGTFTPENPQIRDLPGVGVNTSQFVMNGYANGVPFVNPPFSGGITRAGQTIRFVASYDAGPGSVITTRPVNPNCTGLTRPSDLIQPQNDSTLGVNALQGIHPTFPSSCVSFARSSNNDSQSPIRDGANLTYIPFANDVLTYATISNSNAPKNLTLAELRTIYQANGMPGSPACFGFEPLIPAAPSGVRDFLIEQFGPLGTCVRDTVGGNPLQEHDGRPLSNARQITFVSNHQFIIQTNRTGIFDRHGVTAPRSINGVSPYAPASFPLVRPLFNVVRIADATTPDFLRAFGSTNEGGQICLNPKVLEQFSFASHPLCGSRAIVTD